MYLTDDYHCVANDLLRSDVEVSGLRAELHPSEWRQQTLVDSARFIFNSCITSYSRQPEMCIEALCCHVTKRETDRDRQM